MTKQGLLATLVAGVASLLLLSTASAAQTWTIDFGGLTEGETPSVLSVGAGISGPNVLGADVGVSSDSGAHPAMIFDSDCTGLPDCSGDDDDLGVSQGNVLIISEDNNSSSPNDDCDGRVGIGCIGGSLITVSFDFAGLGTVCIASLDFVDIEVAQINEFTLSGPALAPVVITEPTPGTGDNTVQTVQVDQCGVDLLEWTPNGSGAIDNIEFEMEEQDGWMTGGGNITEGRGRNAVPFSTHGFIIRCDASFAQFQYNDHVNGGNFHLQSPTTVVCTDADLSPQPPATDFDTLVMTGTGTWNGVPGATVIVIMTDEGQPGTNDWFEIEVRDAGNNIVSARSGNLTVGNHQAH